jgi:hypothetical protein
VEKRTCIALRSLLLFLPLRFFNLHLHLPFGDAIFIAQRELHIVIDPFVSLEHRSEARLVAAITSDEVAGPVKSEPSSILKFTPPSTATADKFVVGVTKSRFDSC